MYHYDNPQSYAKLTLVADQGSTSDAGIGGIFSKDALMNFVPLILIFAVFYFFVIRPQIKKQKQQEELVKSIKKGDKIVVAGGIMGKVVKEKENNIIVIEIAKDVNIEALRSSVVSLANSPAQPAIEKKK